MQYDMDNVADGDPDAGISIHSGFPNPAADNFSKSTTLALDLNQLLVRHPNSTYLFRITGHTWADQGIFDGDIAIIDRALDPTPQDLVLVWQDDTFGLHRCGALKTNISIWGVVQAIIHPRNRLGA